MAKPISTLRKRARQGDRGFPKATLAFYGPDDKRASKAVLGIFLRDGDDGIIHRYFSEGADARYKIDIQESILARLREHDVHSLIMMEKIFGCPTRKASTIRKVRRVHNAYFGKTEIVLLDAMTPNQPPLQPTAGRSGAAREFMKGRLLQSRLALASGG
jgi:hypothetical protein